MEDNYAVNDNGNKILEDIRCIIQKDLAELPDFEDIPIPDINWVRMDKARAYINDNNYIPYYYVFSGNPIVVLIKKAVRKLAVCVMDPILDRQNRLNKKLSDCINGLSQVVDKADENSLKVQNDLNRFEGEIICLTNVLEEKDIEIKRLSTRLDELEKIVKLLEDNQSNRR